MFLDIEKAFETIGHTGLLYQLLELEFSTRFIKLTASSLTNRIFEVLVEGKFSTPRKIAAGVIQGSVLSLILCILYANDVPTALALFMDDTCSYATEIERCVLCELQRGLTAVKSWCEHGNLESLTTCYN
jgi:hypothetical protein